MRLFFLFFLTSLFAEIEDVTITEHNGYYAASGLCPIYTDGEKEAELFYIAYAKTDKENRPITFFFPGGPGGAGTLESILTVGPRRILTATEGRGVHPPYQFIDNPESLLDYTDLVFVDPIGTGFSETSDEADLDYLYSVEGDIEVFGKFISTLLNEYSRWNSPIYLAGGSYGTVRCAGLAQHLLGYGIATKGIILDGCALDYSTIFSERDKPLADWLFIPTCAATAWYHKRIWPNQPLEEVLDYARRFAYEVMAPYMLQPSLLSPLEKSILEKTYAELIGLPVETVKRYNCRIDEAIFAAEFFGYERKILGRMDSRYSADLAAINPHQAHDPSYDDSMGVLPAYLHYLQSELETKYSKRFLGFSDRAFKSWNFGTRDSFGPPSFLQRIRRALVVNPKMQIFVGSGYYDCRTPFAATEYLFDHLDLPISYRKNFQFEYYEAGHGFIFDAASLKKWKKDLITFYER